MTTTQTELEVARAVVARLQVQENQKRFDTLEHVGKTFEQSLEQVEYQGEATKDKDGKIVSRIPLSIMGDFLSCIISSKYKITVGQKFVNITNN